MDYGSKVTDAQISELEKRIKEVYSQAEQDINKKLSDFTAAYAVKEGIHRNDVAEGRWTQEQFDNWVKGQVFQGEQWKSKRDQIVGTISNANSVATNMANGYRNNVFTFNANYQAYQLESKAGVNFGFQLYDSGAVTRLIRDNPQILPEWKIDQPKDYTWNYKNVNNAILQGIIQGEKLDQIVDRLSTGPSTNNHRKMVMFARTGMTQAQSAGRLERLKEAKSKGINVKKEWVATLDGHTRWQHADLDSQKQDLDDYFVIDKYKIMYPGDPKAHPSMVYNCRCTLVGDIQGFSADYERYDNIEGKPIKNMTYREWEKAKGKQYSKSRISNKPPLSLTQVAIGAAKSVAEINALLNLPGLFKQKTKKDYVFNNNTMSWDTVEIPHPDNIANLDGCDLDSAKAIASAYEQIFSKYPKLKGQFAAPNAQPVGMDDNTYAWCYLKTSGKVQVNPHFFSNWQKVQKSYDHDVVTGWHPYGTTAESIVVHELGHAVDGLLAREGILGGLTASGQYKYASSTLKNKIMNKAAQKDPAIAKHWNAKDWSGKADKFWQSQAVRKHVSEYATKDNQEWFAECFAEYITSANPRTVAAEFGKELEALVEKLH